MVLKRNESDAYPGARLVAVNPITAGECCKHATTQGLAVAVLAAGGAATFRAGKLFVDVSEATELDVCDGLEPAPTTFDDDPMDEGVQTFVTGTQFGNEEGVFYLAIGATWSVAANKIEQDIAIWTPTKITFSMVADGLPVNPAKIYGYVENACGRVNEAGLEGTYQAGAK